MKSTKTTQNFAVALMVLFGLYGLSMLGLGATLLAYAVGLIVYSYNGNLELTAGAVILVGGILHVMGRLLPSRKAEGFNTQEGADVIAKRLVAIQKPYVASGPQGALSEITEGFSDVETKGQAEGTKDETVAASASSKPAPVEKPKEEGKKETSGFQDEAASSGLFKLGELPSEQKGDFHIDAGTTIIKALGALKPDQLASMTEDTQKLMETQKSLMGMLNSMKPMLTDGQALISQFSGLLGSK